MACSVYIDGIQVKIQPGSLGIEGRIEERSTASFIVVGTLAAATYTRGMPVEIYDDVPSLIFAGFIATPGRAKLAPKVGLLHDIVCMDNHYLADKRLVTRAYTTPGQTLGDIVTDIWTDYLAAEGITVGAIQTGPVIESAIFNYVTVAQAFDALKELSGFTWFINELKALYFVDRSTYAAPWNLDGITHRALKGSTHLSTGNPLYRNRQYVRGGKGITTLQTEHFTGDAVIKSFALGYPLALEPVITEDGGAPLSVGIKGIETGMAYYWNKGDEVIYADTAPGIGVDVEVQYYGQYPLIVLATDEAARVARQAVEGGTGIVEDIVTEAQHESSDAAKESAIAKLTQYCQDAEKFTYQTYDSGLAPGQLQTITHTPSGFTAHEMLIESVSISANKGLVLYTISCITGPSMGSWAKFYANLLSRQDNQLAVGDSLLLVLLQQAETLLLVEATAIHDYVFPPVDPFADNSHWIALPPAQGSGHNVEHEKLTLAEAPGYTANVTELYKWG